MPLTRLGRRANPYPVVQLPYHRLVNPWTLGAVHHEVSHNLQSDLDLWQEVPRRINRRLRQAGMGPMVSRTWTRWHKEMWADLCGLLLGGPAIVASLLDVVARSPRTTKFFNPAGVHPTPYLRVFINLVKNGLQSIPEGRDGVIRIWLELAEERTARVMISDNGKGIPDGIRDKLFQPNFTTKSGGMGMGLAISYNVIRSLGGRIWYNTVINQGTTFYVELPLSVEKS